MKIDDVIAQKVAQKTVAETNTVKGDTWEISIPNSRIHTLAQLIKAFEIDETEWEVERFIANKWEMGYTTGPKTAKASAVEPLYQVKAFLRRKRNIVDAKAEIEDLKNLSRGSMPAHPVSKRPPATKGGMLEINLTDHHFGKLSWKLETLFANYDVKIAAALFWRAFDALLARAPFNYYEEIWFIVGNDLFNADNVEGTTTSGTQVESDVRHKKTYRTVRNLMIHAIDELRKRTDKVKVIVVPGNHDYNSAWHFGDSLDLFFSQDDDVEVDNNPAPRKYHVYGNTLIGFTHGDKGKSSRLPELMAAESRELFGATKFHEWHTGHLHQTRTEEHHGVRVRILPALCPRDKWHSEMGFVGNLRSSEAYSWDKIEGLTHIIIFTDSDDVLAAEEESRRGKK